MSVVVPTSDVAKSDFQIMTSLRYDNALVSYQQEQVSRSSVDIDSPFYLLSFHLDRLLDAAKEFNTSIAQLDSKEKRVQFRDTLLEQVRIENRSVAARVRILVSKTGTISVESSSLAKSLATNEPFFPKSLADVVSNKSLPLWTVYVSPVPTEPSLFTLHKTTKRWMYEEVRENLPKDSNNTEILVVNTDLEVAEASITTPYFLREGLWVTPPLDSGGNKGTTRRFALEKSLCLEQSVKVKDLVNGELCILSNGVRGFFPGKVVTDNLETLL